MIMVDSHNISFVLNKIGVRLCSGLEGRKCFKSRQKGGRLCGECYRNYMKIYMKKKRSGNRIKTFDGYDFDQTNQTNES